ncbi:MAG: universal stress protein [Solirubrobacteraceae bacterium]|nr:universal stress protein [Solirubrobacteraceae bacterium]
MSRGTPVFVVGYDGSPRAAAALAHAATLARGGRIVVVHVHEGTPRQLDERWKSVLAADQEARSRAVLDALPAPSAAALAETTWETRAVEGPAPAALCRVADEVDADAIVVGSHGYGRVSAMLGSVSHALLRDASRPVIVIPPKAADRITAEMPS